MAEVSCVESLLENEPDLAEGAVDVLLMITDNILKDPNNEKFRAINLGSATIERKLIPAIGALEVLFLMGFVEEGNRLVLPQDDSLDNLRIYRQQLQVLKSERMAKILSESSQNTAMAASHLLASEAETKSNLVSSFERVLLYESPALQEKARQLMPVQKLEEQARGKLASINKDIATHEKPMDFQDCMLIELLAWYKSDFFSWFDAPACPMCQENMTPVGSLPPTQEDLIWGGNRVEGFACTRCSTSERFPRYNHPGKLLETRVGRCGEWANCFTLLCRALGMDVRFVYDHTDHVWSEVYSQSQRRWLHADCCENKLDSPLMYEHGWAKKLTYIFAFSKDEAVDVTWRYTTKPNEVLRRRDRCREKWLVSTLIQMNKKRQETFTAPRRNFLEMRLVAEIAEFLGQNYNVKESEKEGRSSGSLEWRVSRGETKAIPQSGYTFRLNSTEEEKKMLVVKYSAAKDQYVRLYDEGEGVTKGWQNGVKEAKNVFRKEETDWKMAYLCRNEGSSEGEVRWIFDWTHTNLKATSALVVLQHDTFEDGHVDWQLCAGDVCVSGPQGGILELSKEMLDRGNKKLEVTANLTKGQGSVAWQHAQIFRQPVASTEFPFYVRLKFE